MKKAFTLAEVLMTLTIIGVVASVTLPSLVNSTKDAELKTAWKKVYAELSQAFIHIVQEQGGSIKGSFPSDISGGESFKNAFKKYLKHTKECSGIAACGGTGNGSGLDGCWHGIGKWSYLDGTKANGVGDVDSPYPGLILDNGMLVYFGISSYNCTYTYSATVNNACGWSYVDVNGFKGPNKIGKDIFPLIYLENYVLPIGAKGNYENTCEGSTGVHSGMSCSAKYLIE